MVEFFEYGTDNSVLTKDQIINFVAEQDSFFEPPLKSRGIVFADYVDKILRQGHIICAVNEENHLIGMIMFYCNDRETRTAFGTWLAVAENARAQGLGFLLVSEMLEFCKNHGMDYYETHTWKTNKAMIAVYQMGFGASIFKEKEEFGRVTVHLRVDLKNR